MSHIKNNFKNHSVQQKSKYRLWICYTAEGIKKGHKRTFLFFSYPKKDGGLANLLKIVQRDKKYIDIGQLFNNITNEKMIEWDYRKPSKKKKKRKFTPKSIQK